MLRQPLQTKTQVITHAVQLLLSKHPSTNQVLTRKSALTATFQYLTQNVPENSPEKASQIILVYVHECLTK
ncbi:hypothetical protein NG791_26455 [Laspinema sp. D1]|uniref:hypothetical protein n=1 Tax=Laspinema palackyanum TaxID=3231601 RepID=UPI00346F15DE|nr:hypothetical protein [Laspinema sp. D2b]